MLDIEGKRLEYRYTNLDVDVNKTSNTIDDIKRIRSILLKELEESGDIEAIDVNSN